MNQEQHQLHLRVVELRGQGMKWREIAEATGRSISHVRAVFSEETWAARQAANQRQVARRAGQGTCVDCGGNTAYNSTRGRVGERCHGCHVAFMSARKHLDPTRLNGGRKVREKQKLLFEFLATGPKLVEEIADYLGTSNSTSVILAYYVRTGRIEHPAFGIYRLPRV